MHATARCAVAQHSPNRLRHHGVLPFPQVLPPHTVTGLSRLIACSLGVVHVLELPTYKELRTMKCFRVAVEGVASWPSSAASGGTLLAVGNSGNINVWDPDSGDSHGVLEHDRPVKSVDVVSGGVYGEVVRLVSGYVDGFLRVWDVATRTCLLKLKLSKQEIVQVRALAPSPQGKVLVVAASCVPDNSLYLCDIDDPGTCLRAFTDHTSNVTAVVALPRADGLDDGSVRFLSTGNDSTVRVWNATSMACEHVLTGHKGFITCAAVLPPGRGTRGVYVATSCFDRCVNVWALWVPAWTRRHVAVVSWVAIRSVDEDDGSWA